MALALKRKNKKNKIKKSCRVRVPYCTYRITNILYTGLSQRDTTVVLVVANYSSHQLEEVKNKISLSDVKRKQSRDSVTQIVMGDETQTTAAGEEGPLGHALMNLGPLALPPPEGE